MKILAVTPYYVPNGGGLERYAHETFRHLAAAGHEVQVVAATTGAPVQADVDGVGVSLERPTFRIGNAPVSLGLTRRLRARIRTEQPDVVVGHGPVPFPAEAAATAAEKERVPFVLTYHAGRLRGSTPMLDKLASAARATTQPRLFARSDGIVAVSRFVRDTALAQHAERATVISPGVDAQMFRPGRADPTTILFAAPLDSSYRWKGLDVLCTAFDMMRAAGVDAQLRLIGSGDREAELKRWAAGRDSIHIDGRLPEAQLVQAFQEAGVVVLPSTQDAEAFGMVLAEANACGRPVVGARTGGIPEFITPGENGELVEPGNPTDLAQTLTQLMASPKRMDAMGRRGRQRVLAEHAWPDIARRTEAVLEAAL